MVKLTRNQIAAFVGRDPDAIRQIEKLFAMTTENSGEIDGSIIVLAGSAINLANQALAEIASLRAELGHAPVPEPFYLTSGDGLTGGGSMGTNLTLAVGAGTAITVGVDTVGVTTNGITDALLRQSAGLSIIGRSANTLGDVADITAATDGQVLRRAGAVVGFGAINLASAGAVTGILPVTLGGTGVTTSTGTGSVVLSASPTLTGTVTAAAITASGLVSSSAGMSVSGNTPPPSGQNIELRFSGGAGIVMSYDRTGATYQQTRVIGSNVTLEINAVAALTVDANRNVYPTAGTTTMTSGFIYIPAAAGAPTGVPTAIAGRVPLYLNTSTSDLYAYNGGWKKVLLT